jgi:hypothetical protein
MAQIFEVDGQALARGIQADWLEQADGAALDGVTVRRRWVTHTWTAAVLPVAEFNRLLNLEGQRVSVTTTDPTDRNGAFATFYGAELTNVSGAHVGPNIQQVTVNFLIRL